MRDEVGLLRAELAEGNWSQLRDPLLPLLLLHDPGPWWAEASVRLAIAVGVEATEGETRTCPPWPWPWVAVEGWVRSWSATGDIEPSWLDQLRRLTYQRGVATAAHAALTRLPLEEGPEAALVLARQLVAYARPREDLDAALAVLDRWPAGDGRDG